MRQRNKKTMCTRLGSTFLGFLGLTYMCCGYLHGALGLNPQGLCLGLGQYGYELVGAGGFGVFKGGAGDWGLIARVGDWMVESKCLSYCCHRAPLSSSLS